MVALFSTIPAPPAFFPVQRGAVVDKPGGRQGMTPLMNAAFFDHRGVANALLGR